MEERRMTIDEFESAIERIRLYVEEVSKSHPDLHTYSPEYQRGYKTCLVESIALEQLGPAPVIELRKR